MATPRQVQANQQNAQLSTGPRTPAGKATVSHNALTHGLFSQATLRAWESAEELAHFRAALVADLAPMGMLEELLVDNIVADFWRLRQTAQLETGVTHYALTEIDQMVDVLKLSAPPGAQPIDDPDQLLQRPETRLGRAYCYDLSTAQALPMLDRHRRSLERSIAEHLDRLQKMQEARRVREEAERADSANLRDEHSQEVP